MVAEAIEEYTLVFTETDYKDPWEQTPVVFMAQEG